jgi:hypothetical protein
MKELLPFLVLIGGFATVAVLMFGIFTFIRAGQSDARRSNKMMQMRVVFQFVTILLMGLLAILSMD